MGKRNERDISRDYILEKQLARTTPLILCYKDLGAKKFVSLYAYKLLFTDNLPMHFLSRTPSLEVPHSGVHSS